MRYAATDPRDKYITISFFAVWQHPCEIHASPVDVEVFDESSQTYKKIGRMVDVHVYMHTVQRTDGMKTRLMVLFRKFDLLNDN